jgi:RNA polymerase sigma-70 factor (ECF subfamily)
VENPDTSSFEGETFPEYRAKNVAFTTTLWTVVLTAVQGNPTALEQLCSRYWYPVYSFVRRRVRNPHEAEDLTQAFFAHLLQKESLKHADRNRGKFRTFLLSSLSNFLNNEWNKRQTLKRGGQNQIISLDETIADEPSRREPAELDTPEKQFERQWALTLLENALARLKREYVQKGKAELLRKLEPHLAGTPEQGVYAECAAGCGMTESAVRTAMHRLRHEYGQLVRQEIADTVETATEVDEELHHLYAAIAGTL